MIEEKNSIVYDLILLEADRVMSKKKADRNLYYKNDDGEEEGWIFNIMLKEAGYPERTIQSFPFKKVNNMDRYNMEYNVLMSVLMIFTEGTLLQWNEIGKMLNTDKELQKVAKETITK